MKNEKIINFAYMIFRIGGRFEIDMLFRRCNLIISNTYIAMTFRFKSFHTTNQIIFDLLVNIYIVVSTFLIFLIK